MADHVIGADDQGVYEIPLEADSPITVAIEAKYANIIGTVTVTVHTFTEPVYVRTGDTVTVADPKAKQVYAGTWGDFYFTPNETAQLALVSAKPAVVSVARS